MASKSSCLAVELLVVLQLATSAMVLPRPPSSPNHIRQEHAFRRIYDDEKSIQGFLQNTNVERPDTENYRLLEIELQGADDMDAANLRGLVHAVLRTEQHAGGESLNESYPNPEVVPHSILGVRKVGPTPNFRSNTYEQDEGEETAEVEGQQQQPLPRESEEVDDANEGKKRSFLSASKLLKASVENEEKLYYLKNGKPKVYVNVRGDSGAFRKDIHGPRTTISEGPLGYLRVTHPFERQTDWRSAKRDKKLRPPKKFDRRVDLPLGSVLDEHQRKTKTIVQSRRNLDQSAAASKDRSTTENSFVTSSELPKQIPAPPSKLQGNKHSTVQTTPVQRYPVKRSDILPGYRFSED